MSSFAVNMVAALGLLLCPAIGWSRPMDVLGEKAFEGAQWIMASSAARAVAQVGARAAAGEGLLADLIRQQQTLQSQIDAKRADLLAVAGQNPSQAASLRAEITNQTALLTSVADRLARDFPQYAEFATPRPFDLAEVRQHLQPGDGLLLILTDRLASYLWLVTPETAVWTRADLRADGLAATVTELRRTLDPSTRLRSAVPLEGEADEPRNKSDFDRSLAYALYRDLLGDIAPDLETVRHLYVVADGPLTSLPLAVLVTEPPQGADNDPIALRQTAWLIRRLALTTLPSVSSLGALRQSDRRSKSSRRGFVGFGAPVLLGASAQSKRSASTIEIVEVVDQGLADPQAIRALTPLPGTEKEIRALAAVLGANDASVFLGDNATETRLKSLDLSAVPIISFATHGLLTGDLAGLSEPALVLTPPDHASFADDGLLTASEASQLRLNADWVILSACNTAAGDGTAGAESLSGLARAFLLAGARAILVSHWPVRDDVAAELTTRAISALAKDPSQGRAKALQSAMLSILQDPVHSSWAQPSAWAPFVVVGNGGPEPLQ